MKWTPSQRQLPRKRFRESKAKASVFYDLALKSFLQQLVGSQVSPTWCGGTALGHKCQQKTKLELLPQCHVVCPTLQHLVLTHVI